MKNNPFPKSFSFRTSIKGIEIIKAIFKSLIVSVFSLKLFSLISILTIATVAILLNSEGCKVNILKLYLLLPQLLMVLVVGITLEYLPYNLQNLVK